MTQTQHKIVLMCSDGTVKEILEQYQDFIEEGYRRSEFKNSAIMIIGQNKVMYGSPKFAKKLIGRLNKIVRKEATTK